MTISNNKQTPGIIQLFRVTFLLYAKKGYTLQRVLGKCQKILFIAK